ncbi:glutamate racemase [Chromobacterium sp. IIBBL 290-4]|uniref:glutamate racemase n=1 Tax=Chromobacterium sp. IIBBL 290-4 TaxID=2953890 RepID=UPI0020B715A4|nr:glutamate racemase [Chromobacterium sp. IIBBL 290-4]UTH74863.1 glutamate racemase [Chromobacterium sp. IIBBL 290-4]
MIAMYDSGLGGLSVWRAVRAALPAWPITYLADQAYCPYGPRSREEIIERALKISRYLISQGATILVVACNTATTAAITAMREEFSLPIVGIEPAIKPAAAMSQTGRIAVLATEYTLASERVQTLLDAHAEGVDVLRRPGHGWVEQVEAGELSSERTRALVRQVVEPLMGENIDHIALGCTHYPFLEPLIREITGDAIRLYDPAEAIARRVDDLIRQHGVDCQGDSYYRFITTADDAGDMAQRLLQLIGHPYPVESQPLN